MSPVRTKFPQTCSSFDLLQFSLTSNMWQKAVLLITQLLHTTFDGTLVVGRWLPWHLRNHLSSLTLQSRNSSCCSCFFLLLGQRVDLCWVLCRHHCTCSETWFYISTSGIYPPNANACLVNVVWVLFDSIYHTILNTFIVVFGLFRGIAANNKKIK